MNHAHHRHSRLAEERESIERDKDDFERALKSRQTEKLSITDIEKDLMKNIVDSDDEGDDDAGEVEPVPSRVANKSASSSSRKVTKTSIKSMDANAEYIDDAFVVAGESRSTKSSTPAIKTATPPRKSPSPIPVPVSGKEKSPSPPPAAVTPPLSPRRTSSPPSNDVPVADDNKSPSPTSTPVERDDKKPVEFKTVIIDKTKVSNDSTPNRAPSPPPAAPAEDKFNISPLKDGDKPESPAEVDDAKPKKHRVTFVDEPVVMPIEGVPDDIGSIKLRVVVPVMKRQKSVEFPSSAYVSEVISMLISSSRTLAALHSTCQLRYKSTDGCITWLDPDKQLDEYSFDVVTETEGGVPETVLEYVLSPSASNDPKNMVYFIAAPGVNAALRPINVDTTSSTVSQFKIQVMEKLKIDANHTSNYSLFVLSDPEHSEDDGVWLEPTNMLNTYGLPQHSHVYLKRKQDVIPKKAEAAINIPLVSVAEGEPQVVLRCVKGPINGDVYVIGKQGAKIGRSRLTVNHIVIPGSDYHDDGDDTVSRQHCLVYTTQEDGVISFWIKNLSEHSYTAISYDNSSDAPRLRVRGEDREMKEGCMLYVGVKSKFEVSVANTGESKGVDNARCLVYKEVVDVEHKIGDITVASSYTLSMLKTKISEKYQLDDKFILKRKIMIDLVPIGNDQYTKPALNYYSAGEAIILSWEK